jgi:Flp pilus assembly protein TadB
MSLLGEFTKGFAIFTGVLWVVAIIGLIGTGYTVVALLLLLVLMIPLSMIAHEYLKNQKKEQT